MARLLDSLYVSGFGSSAASGSVSLYQPGTLTPVVVFSDDALTQPVTQPIVLDANGRSPLPVYTATPVRAIIKASSGATLADITRLDGDRAELVGVANPAFTGTDLHSVLTAIQTSTGGADAKFLGVYSTVPTTLKAEIEQIGLTPQRFGAVGDGVTDDTVAMLNLATAQANSGLPVFLPKGVYKVTSAITFGNNAVIEGVGAYTGGSQILCTNGTQNGLVLGFACRGTSFSVITNVTSSGSALVCGSTCVFEGCRFGSISGAGPFFATGVSNPSSASVLIGCLANGATANTSGNWQVFDTTINGTGTISTGTFTASIIPYSVGAGSFAAATVDVANAGIVTPAIGGTGQSVAYYRIRGTSAGACTINASAAPSSTNCVVLILDCFNNSGGAFTFTFTAQYKAAGNPAPANGSRIAVTFVWNATELVWVETGRATST